jgi:peptidyl-dipeptidase A
MSALHTLATFGLMVLLGVLGGGRAAAADLAPSDARAKQFIERYEAVIRPLEIEAKRLDWTANVTGKAEDFKEKEAAEAKCDLALADPAQFAELKAIKDGGVADRLLRRQIDVLYLEYLEKQVPPELLKRIVAKSNAVEREFNVFRPNMDGKQLTDNDVRRILRESRDLRERKAAWEASKQVGRAVIVDFKALIAVRNEAARKLGFRNYHAMRLYLSEQNEQQLIKLFDELEELTREPFREAKAKMDAVLARNYGITVAELRPWHYHDPFFQESPVAQNELPESIFKKLDPVETCRKFYAGIGLPIDDVLARSDLYEKPGKNPLAFETDIDRNGDVRILENVVPNCEWLCTSLHELGHAVYSKYVGRQLAEKGTGPIGVKPPLGRSGQLDLSPFPLPYVLRTDAHPLCTEGIALMFERFGQNVDWLRAMGADAPDTREFRSGVARVQRNHLLLFARWCQVMFRFERELYANPDQDLSKLWWDLVERYQELKRPEGRDAPDFAAKYHFVGAPVYYHNYMMGEMFASQVHHALVMRAVPTTTLPAALFAVDYVGSKEAGEFLRQRVFAPGMTMPWNELTRYATGEELSAKAFAEDIRALE